MGILIMAIALPINRLMTLPRYDPDMGNTGKRTQVSTVTHGGVLFLSGICRGKIIEIGYAQNGFVQARDTSFYMLKRMMINHDKPLDVHPFQTNQEALTEFEHSLTFSHGLSSLYSNWQSFWPHHSLCSKSNRTPGSAWWRLSCGGTQRRMLPKSWAAALEIVSIFCQYSQYIKGSFPNFQHIIWILWIWVIWCHMSYPMSYRADHPSPTTIPRPAQQDQVAACTARPELMIPVILPTTPGFFTWMAMAIW